MAELVVGILQGRSLGGTRLQAVGLAYPLARWPCRVDFLEALKLLRSWVLAARPTSMSGTMPWSLDGAPLGGCMRRW